MIIDKNKVNISVIILIFIINQLGICRQIDKTIMGTQFRRENGWIFLDRMVVGAGNVDLVLDLQLETNKNYSKDIYELHLLMIPDSQWKKDEKMSCQWLNRKIENNQNTYETNSAVFSKQTDLKAINQSNFKIQEQQTYHIVITDCKKTLINQYFNKKARINISANLIMQNQMHSKDQQLHLWFLIILIGLALFSYKYLNIVNKQEHRSTDYPRLILKIASISNIISIVISLVHYLLYAYILGYYLTFFQFLQAFIDPISDAFLMTLLTLLAFGWSTKAMYCNDFQLYCVLAAMIGFSYTIVNVLTKINDSNPDKYHFHDSVPSIILMGFRGVIFIIFLFGILKTMNGLIWAKKVKQNLLFNQYQKILVMIGIMGICYMPLIVFFSSYVSIGWRQAFVFLSLRVTKTVCLLSISWMITHKNSPYRKICLIDKSFCEEVKGL